MTGDKYTGMTVYERLYVSGLINEYDKAVERKDAQKIQEILEKVELTKPNIEPILRQLGL